MELTGAAMTGANDAPDALGNCKNDEGEENPFVDGNGCCIKYPVGEDKKDAGVSCSDGEGHELELMLFLFLMYWYNWSGGSRMLYDERS